MLSTMTMSNYGYAPAVNQPQPRVKGEYWANGYRRTSDYQACSRNWWVVRLEDGRTIWCAGEAQFRELYPESKYDLTPSSKSQPTFTARYTNDDEEF